jgi:ribonuclease HII
MRVMGIDEAGRGCVLGPLVIAAFWAEDVAEDRLRDAGADDSKRLSPKRRLAARERLGALGTPDVRFIDAGAIDAGNLNQLEEATIAALVARWDPDAVVCDALGHPKTLPAVIARIRAMIPNDRPDRSWLMAPKADHDHPICGAASIFAKTRRDEALDALRGEFGEFGSGYPSDEVTRTWLSDWARTGRPWPAFVRTRWGTIASVTQSSMF